MYPTGYKNKPSTITMTTDEFNDYVNKKVAEEREECAKIADLFAHDPERGTFEPSSGKALMKRHLEAIYFREHGEAIKRTAQAISDIIRSRGKVDGTP